MTQEEKQLLLKDLCARLHYELKIKTSKGDGVLCSIDYIQNGAYLGISINGAVKDYYEYQDTKPYLRPMSSMTEEEKILMATTCLKYANGDVEGAVSELSDFYNSRHLDYHGLIGMGLALEAPEGMYKTE